jgi:hypothetical protein
MTEDSIDFQPFPTTDQPDAPVRHSFRVPTSDKENILAIFGGQTYAVANISVTGISIHADSCLDFEAGQVVEDAEFWIGTLRLTGLKGTVIHCSVHDDGELQFGIDWLDMSVKNRETLETVLSQMKTSALKQDHSPEDQAAEEG